MARPVVLPASGVASVPHSPSPAANPAMRRAFHHLAVNQIDRRAVQAEQPQARFQDGVEHGRGVRGRFADDTEHFGCRRLFASRRGKFGARFGEFAAQRV